MKELKTKWSRWIPVTTMTKPHDLWYELILKGLSQDPNPPKTSKKYSYSTAKDTRRESGLLRCGGSPILESPNFTANLPSRKITLALQGKISRGKNPSKPQQSVSNERVHSNKWCHEHLSNNDSLCILT